MDAPLAAAERLIRTHAEFGATAPLRYRPAHRGGEGT
jgi:hypothetical protein